MPGPAPSEPGDSRLLEATQILTRGDGGDLDDALHALSLVQPLVDQRLDARRIAAMALLLIARAHRRAGRAEPSLDALDEALALEILPDSCLTEVQMQRGQALAELGRDCEALHAYREAVQAADEYGTTSCGPELKADANATLASMLSTRGDVAARTYAFEALAIAEALPDARAIPIRRRAWAILARWPEGAKARPTRYRVPIR